MSKQFRAVLVRPFGWGNQHGTRWIGPKPARKAGTVGNSSGYRGVWERNEAGKPVKYRACISVDNKTYHLGTFDDKIEAAKAYDDAAMKYHGADAVLNFPHEHYEEHYNLRPTEER
jgi:hypothetical protein